MVTCVLKQKDSVIKRCIFQIKLMQCGCRYCQLIDDSAADAPPSFAKYLANEARCLLQKEIDKFQIQVNCKMCIDLCDD